MPCLFLVPQRAAGSSTARTIYGVFRTIVSVELGALQEGHRELMAVYYMCTDNSDIHILCNIP